LKRIAGWFRTAKLTQTSGRTANLNMTWMQQVFGQSVETSHVASIVLGGYLIGCLTSGYYLVRLRLGLDIREMGSGSVGARNAGRVLGVPGFLMTLVGDFAKGAGVVWLARHFTEDERLAGLAMLAAVLGHIWPLQLGFRGGKGIATSLGALCWYDFHLALLFAALTALLSLFGRMSLAGLVTFALLPLAARMMDRGLPEVLTVSVLAGMILVAHRRNLADEFAHLAVPPEEETKTDESLE
jgi:glycerol-3-phosphate acyltransferase PlsY